eukprot:TRINITY_DN22880_c0_g1_i2.p1 TRINITY_DN22880_c0_g1~~TRINITY_DN22880_c0_g1_i2.p1  ORF type:complete len:585 (-),score=134.78 TRINITY_DN22880_c0_g1_i2:328-2082(-)
MAPGRRAMSSSAAGVRAAWRSVMRFKRAAFEAEQRRPVQACCSVSIGMLLPSARRSMQHFSGGSHGDSSSSSRGFCTMASGGSYAAMEEVLAGVPAICGVGDGGALESAWLDSAEPLIAAGQVAEGLAVVVHAACEANDLRKARRLVLRLLALEEWSREEGVEFVVPASLWSALVGAHARAGDADAGFAMLGRSMQSPDAGGELSASVFEALIGGLVESGRPKLAFETFERMRTLAMVDPSAELYTVMIRASARMRDPDSARGFYDELVTRKQVSAEARAEYIIATASRLRTTRLAFQLFSEAARLGEELRLDVCGALAAACARAATVGAGAAASMEEALKNARLLQRRMAASDLLPDTRTQANLVRTFGLAAAAATDAAASESSAASSPTSSRTSTSSSLQDASRSLANAWRIVAEARESGPVPVAVLEALLQAYCSGGESMLEHAVTLLDMYPELAEVPADATSYALVLDAYASYKQTEKFRDLWTSMLGYSESKPTEAMLRQALNMALAAKDGPWTISVLQLMYEARALPEAEVAAAIHAMPQRVSGEAKTLLRALERLPAQPTLAEERRFRHAAASSVAA